MVRAIYTGSEFLDAVDNCGDIGIVMKSTNFYAEQGDTGLLVLQHHKMYGSVLMAIEFEIFKTRDGIQLVKVNTLDDQIVLLSDTCFEIIQP